MRGNSLFRRYTAKHFETKCPQLADVRYLPPVKPSWKPKKVSEVAHQLHFIIIICIVTCQAKNNRREKFKWYVICQTTAMLHVDEQQRTQDTGQ